MNILSIGKKSQERERKIKEKYGIKQIEWMNYDNLLEYIKRERCDNKDIFVETFGIDGMNKLYRLIREKLATITCISFSDVVIEGIDNTISQVIHKDLDDRGVKIKLSIGNLDELPHQSKESLFIVFWNDEDLDDIYVEDLGLFQVGEKVSDLNNQDFDYVYTIFNTDSGSKDSIPLFLKLIFSKPNGMIVGAQSISSINVSRLGRIIKKAIAENRNLNNIIDMEILKEEKSYFDRYIIEYTAIVGRGVLEGDFRQIHLEDIRKIYDEGGFFLDVREPFEFEEGHIRGAKHIPMRQIINRLHEIPRDENVYIYCRSAQRSYSVLKALEFNGFDKLYNVSGSFLGLSFNEFFMDKYYRESENKIVTAYNFR